jgi:hypothetical protein
VNYGVMCAMEAPLPSLTLSPLKSIGSNRGVSQLEMEAVLPARRTGKINAFT